MIEDGRVIVIDKVVALEGGNTVTMEEDGYRTHAVENDGDFEAETVAMQELLRDYKSTGDDDCDSSDDEPTSMYS